MLGLMQDWPLTVDKIIDHARTWHGDREVVTRSVEGPVVRTTYAQIHARAQQTSNALLSLGISLGDRVATLAWCTGRHMDLWYGIMGIGAICHTLNPRLHPQQLAWIINHAGDRAIFTDLTFLPLVEGILPFCPTIERVVVLTDADHMPAFTPRGDVGPAFKGAVDFESLIGGQSDRCAWGGFDENTAAGLCYTSGTTGDPKGVLYSHRSNFLHTYATLTPDVMNVSARDTVLAVVPMFHANGWGLAFGGPAAGAKLVMPGPKLDGASLYELIESEGVTFTAAVPTVWQGLLQYLAGTDLKFSTLKRVLIGGAAVSESVMRTFGDLYGVEVIHAWGMTETSPLGTVSRPTAMVEALDPEAQMPFRMKQGRPPLGIELKVTDEAGAEQPSDGETFGHLKVRGPFVAREYFRGEGAILDRDGFFDTGDIATLDPHGYMQITDRSKDVIKSGGEWISSIDIENIALAYPKTALAAVIGRPHPKWDERPLLIVKLKDGEEAKRQEYLDFLEGKIAKWWTPDDVVFTDDIPLGPTGKIDKKVLRARYADYVFPAVAGAAGVIAEAAARAPVLHAPEPAEAEAEAVVDDAEATPVESTSDALEPVELEETAGENGGEPAGEENQPPQVVIAAPCEPAADDRGPVDPGLPTEEQAGPAPAVEPLVFDSLETGAAEPATAVADAAHADSEPPLMFAPLEPAAPSRALRGDVRRHVLNGVIAVTLLPAVLVLAGAAGGRFGLFGWEVGYGLLTMQWAPKAAMVGMVASLAGAIVVFTGGQRLWRQAAIALVIVIATLIGLFTLREIAAPWPAGDVATDWRDPLSFSSQAMAARGEMANPVDLDPVLPIGSGPFAGRRIADVNAATCSSAKPLTSPKAASDVYEAARDALRDAGVKITRDDPTTGRLEGVATSLAYGAKDDVAARVRPTDAGARLDIRSISREGESDLGRNCRRVTNVLKRVAG